MSIKANKSDVAWGYVAQIFQFGSALFILPIALHQIPEKEMGLWYTFLAVIALTSLLDFGFQNAISINVNYVYSGARKLLPEGFDSSSVSTGIDNDLLAGLIKSVQKAYAIIALAAGILMGIPGTLYIHKVSLNILPQPTINSIWIGIIAATMITLYAGMYQSLLQGKGMIKNIRISMIVSRSIFLIVSLVALGHGWKLASLSIGMVCQAISNLVMCRLWFFNKETKEMIRKSTKPRTGLLKVLMHNSKKIGIIAIGSFLINRGNTLVCGYFLEPKVTAKYGLTIQIMTFVVQFSTMGFYSLVPHMNSLRVQDQQIRFKKLVAMGWFASIAIFIGIGTPILVGGNYILRTIGSNTSFLNESAFLLVFITLLLETNHSIAAGAIATGNVIPYTKPAIISGVIILITSASLAKFTQIGIWSLLLPQFTVQLAYNNWKWPKSLLRELNTSIWNMMRLGFAEMKLRIILTSKKPA